MPFLRLFGAHLADFRIDGNSEVLLALHRRSFCAVSSVHDGVTVAVNLAFSSCRDHHFLFALFFISFEGCWRECRRWSEAIGSRNARSMGWWLNGKCSRTGVEGRGESSFLHEKQFWCILHIQMSISFVSLAFSSCEVEGLRILEFAFGNLARSIAITPSLMSRACDWSSRKILA